MNANSQLPADTRAARGRDVRERAGAEREARQHEQHERRDLQRGEDVHHHAAGSDAADVNRRQQPHRRERHQRVRGKRQRHVRQRDGEDRRLVVDARDEAREVDRNEERVGGDRAGEAGDERRPAGEERGDAAVGGVEIDVLAAGLAAAAPPARRRPSRRRTRARRRPATGRDTATDSAPRPAMNGGANRIVPPMTLETMIAAPSSGPRRRSRVECGRHRPGLYGACDVPRVPKVPSVPKILRLTRVSSCRWIGILGELGEDLRSLLQVDLDLGVDELAVLQHLHARLLAGIAERGAHHQRLRFRRRRPAARCAASPSRNTRPTSPARRRGGRWR